MSGLACWSQEKERDTWNRATPQLAMHTWGENWQNSGDSSQKEVTLDLSSSNPATDLPHLQGRRASPPHIPGPVPGLLPPEATPRSSGNLLQRDLFSQMRSLRHVGPLLPFVNRGHSHEVSPEQERGISLAPRPAGPCSGGAGCVL